MNDKKILKEKEMVEEKIREMLYDFEQKTNTKIDSIGWKIRGGFSVHPHTKPKPRYKILIVSIKCGTPYGIEVKYN